VLDLCFSERDLLGEDAFEALQSLADQISVAIENARVYAAEREAVQRLSRLDHFRLASMGVGSRELATELNTIIGFSRLLLKGVDGALSDLQRTDLVAIYKSGYRLSGLIDNVVTLSELEGGTVAISRDLIDLERLLGEVLAVAERYLVDVGIDWQRETELPLIDGDRSLLRQAFLGSVTAVAEQASSAKLALRTRVSREDASTVVIMIEGENGETPQARPSNGLAVSQGRELEEMSVGLALARRIIALHHGEVRFWFEVERGLRSAIVLPAGRGEGRDASN
jgi:K+-sensing histidine kinase KdpD